MFHSLFRSCSREWNWAIARCHLRCPVCQIGGWRSHCVISSHLARGALPLSSAFGRLLVVSPRHSIWHVRRISQVFRVVICTVCIGNTGDASWRGAAGFLVVKFSCFELEWWTSKVCITIWVVRIALPSAVLRLLVPVCRAQRGYG